MRFLIALLLIAVVAMLAQRLAVAAETPEYRVEREASGYEVRVYDPFIVAEVTVEGEASRAMNEGFRQLADFIFGSNDKETEISMTAPVLERRAAGKKSAKTGASDDALSEADHVVSFVMPRKFTMESLPKPDNNKITIRKVATGRYAVSTFSGYAQPRAVREHDAELRGYLERDGLAAAGERLLAQYNPPWTPPEDRRNEILIPLTVEEDAASPPEE